MPQLRWSIGSVLTVGIVLVVALLMTVTTVLDIRRERSLSETELHRRGELVAETLNEVLANQLYHSDVDSLRDTAELIQRQSDVLSMRVFTPEGRAVVDTSQHRYPTDVVADEHVLSAMSSRAVQFRKSDGAVEVAAPIAADKYLFGGVSFVFSTASVDAKIREIAVQRIWQSLALGALGIIVSYLIAQRFARPIRQLVDATRKVAEGDYEPTALDHRTDEHRRTCRLVRKHEGERPGEYRETGGRQQEVIAGGFGAYPGRAGAPEGQSQPRRVFHSSQGRQ